ncbi:ectoine/hydroxyectoine ABC transporter permease subunit EhuC [Paenibacillus senegalensis]|uniref:ectoine/hydroxyectoine ABC transporter permease subunit EhuC n=1 Tax=Paenibacillus senegalensis TaxID=1465766 RepID=UPI00028929FD|nr:ectoine/hydroxyectoine ABC transporter permease subunit EhuC [Paenibacillus senegalensis]
MSIEYIVEFMPSLLRGAAVTLEITLYSLVAAFVLSFIAGLARLSKWRIIRFIAAAYVEVLRGTSLLVQLFWIYFALPVLLDINLTAMQAGVLALGLNYGAYGSEVVRSSILAVPKGQTEASIALNFTPYQRMRYIILPQAIRSMLPSFGNLQIELLKGTSLVYLITITELLYAGMQLRTYNMSQTTLIFTLLLVIYFVIAFAFNTIIRLIERKVSVGRS